ncbi:hypothetical protein CHLRE_09g401150v5 [Chlamydomonas reinhardtii]|uniref:Uncharacterized protein n=1 Tax=Chlamydomonas reinhardtii TaxID=3055 RepID=A0A2K3DCT0_CHLRE|nr:uncharacterized protein CHLRE_09g401150v5 [Chlamydomonas reinhardtii]XP_042920795.1 uncharacterized protein CHLRE_09g401150v5 [Chlamydomonas reinhardtii]PNW78340.1 hypothetical protein CHLRE_09g401150v5 [Chlamydomonas reinhardtii]PNW78341.1 hypothetical protein CHLRE_09g401150v5 [Chlamydomonas reinhardtii]
MAGRPPAYGPVRRAFGKVYDLLMRKEKVGEDALGNVYYRWYEGSGEHRTERREVQWVSEHMYYDPKEVPAEWRMWLRRLRQDPPTPEELVQSAAKAATLSARVAALEEAERLRRLRQQTVGTPDQHAGATPDMARFLQQMGGSSQPQPQQQQQQAPAQPQGQGQAAKAGGEPFKPEAWRPGS